MTPMLCHKMATFDVIHACVTFNILTFFFFISFDFAFTSISLTEADFYKHNFKLFANIAQHLLGLLNVVIHIPGKSNVLKSGVRLTSSPDVLPTFIRM